MDHETFLAAWAEFEGERPLEAMLPDAHERFQLWYAECHPDYGG